MAASVREALDAFHADPSLPQPSDGQAVHWALAELLRDPELAAYLRWRTECVISLVREARATLPPSMRLSVIPSVNQPLALAWLESSDLGGLAEPADIIEILGYRASPGEVAADTWWARRRIGVRARLHVALRPAYPDTPDEANLLAKARAVQEAGIDGISFYNYGHIRLGHLAWVRRALGALGTPG